MRRSFRFCVAAVWVVASSALARDELKITPKNPTGIYSLGQTVEWTVTTQGTSSTQPAPTDLHFVIRKNNLDTIKSGTLDLSAGSATIDTSADEPAMLYLEITGAAKDNFVAGAAVAPTKLGPVAERPADFDSFWESKIAELEKIPPNPVLTPHDSGDPAVDYATIQMDHVNGTHVYGQIATPKRDGKFPALVQFQWASPPYPLQKSWIMGYAQQGWIALDIEPHNVLPDQPKSYYDGLPDPIKHYESTGNDDRDKSVFCEMYLRDFRAVDYLASRPDWDGKTLLVIGTSMGGQQSLCVAGLHPKITHLIVDEPAGCDTNAALHGRQEGYPFFPANNPKVMQTALYFDPINFAPHIHAKSMVAMGFVDTIAPPAGIWTAYNEIPAPKQAVPMIDSPHNNLATPAEQHPYNTTSSQWIDALTFGADPKITFPMGEGRASIPEQRFDANSNLAHKQMVAKAKKGGIDLYFLGDSITRRWGCSDAIYKDFLANWKSNFFGYNAADFGWGGDTVQNILWRINNGELDGVNPKVIVILAGTNNVGREPCDAAKIADIAGGIKTLVTTCQSKAPRATIILTAIFPRNDTPSANRAINQINEKIATLADGKTVRFLNVNATLADADGQLFPGMTIDRLHPTVDGYQTWADGLKPILTELLGPPSSTDHAPPPTGDPSAAGH